MMEILNLQTDTFKEICRSLYGEYSAEHLTRYESIVAHFAQRFGATPTKLFSSPGRTEISGNHTDHNGGKVLTASVTVDAVCGASPTDDSIITLYSEGYDEPFVVDTRDLAIRPQENGTTGLIRGVCAGFMQHGRKVGGFTGYVSSTILFASGLSSSAAFEMLVAAILNEFFNDGALDVVTRARIGQFAENEYWGKPSGLLDQMACGVGGIISIDFKERTNPAVRRVDFDLASQGYKLLVVNTGGNHADLTDAYAEIPNEMWEAARICGATRCGEITQEALIQKIPEIRLQLGDRAVLRALHFFEENTRVDQQIAALERDDFSSFLRLVHESGSSSWRLLQNCYLASTPRTQPIPSCLAITSSYMETHNIAGACRVHGGGFAGVIAVFLPRQHVEPYTRFIEGFFGRGCVTTLGIRQRGAGAVLDVG